jgi:hypothetical protein
MTPIWRMLVTNWLEKATVAQIKVFALYATVTNSHEVTLFAIVAEHTCMCNPVNLSD